MDSTYLYVGNLPFSISRRKLADLFCAYKLQFIGFASGRDFAYVAVPSAEAETAISTLNGTVCEGYSLSVLRANYCEPLGLGIV